MPLHDYRCLRCGQTAEHFVPMGTQSVDCPNCLGTAELVFLKVAKPDWLSLAQGSSASPEAIDRFEKMHKQQTAKEQKSLKDHGDYGTTPGGDGAYRAPPEGTI